MSTRPTALLVGAFGFGDLGEDALIAAFAGGLPDWELVVGVHGRQALNVVGCTTVSGLSALLGCLNTVKALLLTGDGVFTPASRQSPGCLYPCALLAMTAAARGLPVVLVGSGIPPLWGRSERLAARLLVSATDLLIAHGYLAARRLIAAGVPAPLRVATDLAWVLVDDPVVPAPSGDGLVVALDAAATGGWFTDRLAEVLSRLPARLRVRLQPWRAAGPAPDDVQMAKLMACQLPQAEIEPAPASLPQARDAYRSARAVIALRPRAQVAAAAAGVPSLAVTSGGTRQLIADGLHQPSVAMDASPEQLSTAVHTVLSAPPPPPQVVRDHVDLAREVFRLVELVLSGGRSNDSEIAQLDLHPRPWAGSRG